MLKLERKIGAIELFPLLRNLHMNYKWYGWTGLCGLYFSYFSEHHRPNHFNSTVGLLKVEEKPLPPPRMDKIFNDCVHGHMSFCPLLVKIIDTPEFQRLRNIKQLGLAYYVYPSASHNRFEHSLGTCHLAGKLLNTLSITHEINARDKLCVQIAALCHDLGHGPFSHTWECFLHREGIEWKHETSSIEIFDQIYNDNKKEFKKYELGEDEVDLIKCLISGDSSTADEDKHFLFQIVNNKDNDIDVDKWDYIARDAQLLGVRNAFDYTRLIEFCRILPVQRKPKTDQKKAAILERNEICYRDKEISNVFDMFISRASLHDKAYQHKVVKVVETMVIDALHFAQEDVPELLLTDTSTHTICRLTDHVLYLIKNDTRPMRSQGILTRVEKRNLYKIIHTYKVDEKIRNCPSKDLPFPQIEEKIYDVLKLERNTLTKADIGVIDLCVGMGSAYKDRGLIDVFTFGKESTLTTQLRNKDYKHLLSDSLKTNNLRTEILVIYKGTDEIKENSFATKTWKSVDEMIKGFCLTLQNTTNMHSPQNGGPMDVSR